LLQYIIGLGLIQGIGDVKAKKLIAYCGSAEAVFKEKKSHLLKIPGIGAVLSQEIATQKVLAKAEEELKFIKENGIKPLFYLDNDYPNRLKYCDDGPILLYYKGNADLNVDKVIGIVGTRSATDYGKAMCRLLIDGMAAYNVLIVSGLAYGIDSAAHRAALDKNLKTVGVLGHGLDMLYPAQNIVLAQKMVENGGILSEFMSKTIPDKENFPKRNRIIAGMCDAVVVVEAAHRGGALITAELALSYNRDVMAVPGTVISNYSKGCNKLIKTNKAALIESADDIIYTLGWENLKKKKNTQNKLFDDLNDNEKMLLNLLNEGQASIDEIIFKSKLPISKAAAILLEMEFKGFIEALPGKLYRVVK